MKGLPAIYAQQLKTSLASMLQYRAALIIWLIGNILEPLILLVVWTTVAGSSGGNVVGFGARDFAAYYIVLMVVNQWTFSWVMYEFDYRIREGLFSTSLLHPLHPIHEDIADNLSYKAATLPVLAGAAAAMTFVFHPAFRISAWMALAFVPAMVMAFLVRFLVEWTVALAAFWTTRTGAINQIHYMAVLFFSGQIAPLAILPRPLQVVATALPFRWAVGFPVELVLGRLSPAQAIAGFGAQAAWLLGALLILKFAWRLSLKHYSAVGG
jgi:ABC-2 type transport system permease protein